MRVLTDESHRINVSFSRDTTIRWMKKYDSSGNAERISENQNGVIMLLESCFQIHLLRQCRPFKHSNLALSHVCRNHQKHTSWTDVSSIDSIPSWVKLMSVTGLTHGATPSYTRLSITPEITIAGFYNTRALSRATVYKVEEIIIDCCGRSDVCTDTVMTNL